MTKSGATFEVRTDARALARITGKLERAENRIAIAWHAAARQAAPVDLGRLRASIAFATGSSQPMHSASYPGKGSEPGGTVSYKPPNPGTLTAAVGSNVEYALAVHEGLPAQTVQVRAHTRTVTQFFGRRVPPTVVHVRAHSRFQSARAPMKFIEGPGRMLMWRFREIVVEELRSLEGEG